MNLELKIFIDLDLCKKLIFVNLLLCKVMNYYKIYLCIDEV